MTSYRYKDNSRRNRILRTVGIIGIVLILALVLWRVILAGGEVVPVCGQSPVDAPPSTAEWCDELPPPGLHAGVAWQSDEFEPGRELQVVDALHLRSYYNWQPDPRPENSTAPEHLYLDPKHVPMYYDLTLYSDNFAFPSKCEFTLLWNEPDVGDQANQPPDVVALYTSHQTGQQAALCYRPEIVGPDAPQPFTNWGGLGTLMVDWDSPTPIQSGYVAEYLRQGGPLPDAWVIHAYSNKWDGILRIWNATEEVLDEYPEIGMKDGHKIPVIISETAYAPLPGESHDTAEQHRMMTNLHALIADNDRLWSAYWFVGHGWNKYQSEDVLVDNDGNLTALGAHFNEIRGCNNVPVSFMPSVFGSGQLGAASDRHPAPADWGTILPCDPDDVYVPPTPTAIPVSPTETPAPGCEGIPVLPPPACYNGNPNPPSFCSCYEG